MPLQFSSDNLNIIYGTNGAGKSGYVRILKQACGARKVENLLNNVYNNKTTQECKFLILKDGTEKEIQWVPQKGIEKDLSTIDIYDSSCGLSYVMNNNEVTYEPAILRFLSYLVDLTIVLTDNLKGKQDKLNLCKPLIDYRFADTSVGKLIANLNSNSNFERDFKSLKWNSKKLQKLLALEKKLLNSKNEEIIKTVNSKIDNMAKLIAEIKRNEKWLSLLSFRKLNVQRKKIEAKKQEIKKIESILRGQKLNGVGNGLWLKLWQVAKEFSEQYAYPALLYPNVTENSKCVLCQQDLDFDSKKRFITLDNFTKSKLYKELDELEETLLKQINLLPVIWDDKMLDQICLNLDLTGDVKNAISEAFQSFNKRISVFKTATNEDSLPVSNNNEVIKSLNRLNKNLIKTKKGFVLAATVHGTAKVTSEITNLASEKWLHESKQTIKNYIDGLVKESVLIKAKTRTNSLSFSTKKSELAESLVSKVFIENFDKEVAKLGGSQLKVKIEKSKTSKGKVYYTVKLKGSILNLKGSILNEKIEHVLSEGEFRIVSLAAFLADVSNKEYNSSFIFDDPISSLDIDYEEATVKRIIELSKERQVIVFTHRLSFFSLLNDEAEKENLTPNNLTVTSEYWGTGQPSQSFIATQKPERALNTLLERLNHAKKILETKGKSEFEPVAKSICSDFRILIERIIENVLLNQIVIRYRRSIMTKDKMDVLVKINKSDVELMESMMTEYSKFEHSQSLELPNPVVDSLMLQSDLEKIKNWITEFKNRS